MTTKEQKKTKNNGTFFIAKKIMPEGDNQSAVLPSDQWMVKNAWQSARSSKSFLKHAAGVVGHALMSVASVATVAVGAVLVATTNIAAAAILVGAIGAGYFGKKTKDTLKNLKKTHLPHIQKEMKSRLLKFKAEQFMSAMKTNLDNQKKGDAPTQKSEKSYKSGLFSGLFKKSSKPQDQTENQANSMANDNAAPEKKAQNSASPKK